ncbi:MAG: DUF2079 domain-containing protein [Anaerolineaceae bacterium]|nr:DUF2079 domain-containing protein [Anaerolineaceae bacterium]
MNGQNVWWKRPLPFYLLLVLMVAFFALFTWLSLARYHAFTSRAFDLGAMSQAIWSATQGKPLIFTVEGITLSRLARHVELFYFLLAPIYALWPAPSTLLILQAGLAVAGALPLYSIANRHLKHTWSALAIAAIYLLYPVLQTAVLFEFHGDTLAMPLLLFALDSLDRQAGRTYFFWLALALSCKFYVAVPVAALGAMLWWYGQKQTGWQTFLLAAVWGGVAFGVIRPYFAPPDAVYVEATARSYIGYYFSQLNLAQTGALRLSNAVIVFAPVLLLAWRAPRWLLPATAVILPVLLSSGPGPSFDFQYHHYALGVPFLMMGLIEGTATLRQSSRSPSGWQRRLAIAFLLTLLLNSFLVNTPLNPKFYQPQPGSGAGLDTLAGYGRTARDALKFTWMAPLQATQQPLAADRSLARLATNRDILYLVPPENKSHEELLPKVETVAVDALYDFALLDHNQNLVEGGVQTAFPTIRWLLNQPNWHLVRAQDGLLEFGRQNVGLTQEVTIQTAITPAEPMAHFGAELVLLNSEITPLDKGLYQMDFFWQAERPFPPNTSYFAVTRLDGLANSRIIHLPTLGILPISAWAANTIVHESFVFALPENAPAGSYVVKTGWYNANLPWAAATDGRSRLGEEVIVGTITVIGD